MDAPAPHHHNDSLIHSQLIEVRCSTEQMITIPSRTHCCHMVHYVNSHFSTFGFLQWFHLLHVMFISIKKSLATLLALFLFQLSARRQPLLILSSQIVYCFKRVLFRTWGLRLAPSKHYTTFTRHLFETRTHVQLITFNHAVSGVSFELDVV